MVVQPMKAIAAVAITEGLTVPQIVAAGATVSAVVLLLGLTGLIDWLNRVVPKSVVRGLQLALGLSLVKKGLQMVAATNTLAAPDSWLTGGFAALLVLLLASSRALPAAIVLFGAGIALTVVAKPEVLGHLGFGLTFPSWAPPHFGDFLTAFPVAALPQIPLPATPLALFLSLSCSTHCTTSSAPVQRFPSVTSATGAQS